MSKLIAFMLGGALLLAGPLATQSDRALLLFIHAEFRFSNPGTINVHEIEIYRDGLVRRTIEPPGGGKIAFRNQASPAALARLREMLSLHRIGHAVGDCNVPASTVGSDHTTRITWYGKPPRRNTFKVGSLVPGACSADTLALYHAIVLVFQNQAMQDPMGTFALIPPVPDPFCEQD